MSQDTNIDTGYNYHTTQPQLNIATTQNIQNNDTQNNDIKDNLSNKFLNNDDNLINTNASNEEVNSESDDDENFVSFGYEALPQDDDDDVHVQEENNDFMKVQPLQIHTSDQEKIPDDDLAVINSIMKNIKLPDTAIPEWAKSIPEEAWLPIVINDPKSNHNT